MFNQTIFKTLVFCFLMYKSFILLFTGGAVYAATPTLNLLISGGFIDIVSDPNGNSVIPYYDVCAERPDGAQVAFFQFNDDPFSRTWSNGDFGSWYMAAPDGYGRCAILNSDTWSSVHEAYFGWLYMFVAQIFCRFYQITLLYFSKSFNSFLPNIHESAIHCN